MSDHKPGELAAALFGILERVEHGQNDDYSNSAEAQAARSYFGQNPNPTPLELEILTLISRHLLGGVVRPLELHADRTITHRSILGHRVDRTGRICAIELGTPRRPGQ